MASSSSLSNRLFAFLVVTVLVAAASAARAEDPAPYSQGFEADDALTSAAVKGKAAIDHRDSYKGNGSLSLTRTKPEMEKVPTEVAMPSFPATEGLWDASVTMRSRLYSPDSSYNGTARVEVLDAAGKSLVRMELGLITKDTPWKTYKKRIELPAEAASARFVLTMEKTYGDFQVDELAAVYVGPSLRTVRAIKFASEAVGNLFLPDQPVKFDVTAECSKERPEAERVVTCTITDYWGAEFSEPLKVELTPAGTTPKGRHAYKGTLDLSGQKLETGKYYEIHAEMSEAMLPEPGRDTSTFAVLPLAVTKQYKPFDIPFTASGWSPPVGGFYPLCDRLGLRVANVYSRWKAKPPYESTAPGIEVVKKLGMGALMSTSVSSVERDANSEFDETALREGAKKMVERYSKQLPIMIRNGNEPHAINDADAQRMIRAYQAVYDGVKAADPNVLVTSTSAGPDEIFFKNGFQKAYDVYDFHAYSDFQSLHHTFEEYDKMVAKYGQRKPVWSTEIGLNSEGMARSAVATEMIKIFTNFFVEGGQNVSWFGIMYPDPDARIVGSNGDSFDVYNSKYSLYSPKLSAISEYYMVNGICIKKVVGQKVYANGETLTLFRDAENRCLLVAWKNGGRGDAFIPLPGVNTIKATRLDGGSSQFDAAGKGITLGLSDEPCLMEFTSADLQLPAELGKPAAGMGSEIPQIVKGGSVLLGVATDSIDPSTVELIAPPRWTVERQTQAGTIAAFKVTAPAGTNAKVARIVARLGTAGEILLPLPVVDPLDVRFMPVPVAKGGDGMGLRLTNRGAAPQTVKWKVTVAETFPMGNGTFKLGEPQKFAANFTTPSEGEQTLAPGAVADLDIRADNFDPHSLYRARVELVVDGKTISQERIFGGCPGVPKVSGGVVFDGKLGDPKWENAAVVTLDQPNQFAEINKKTAGWTGPDDLSGTMKLLWDDKYLYVGMSVKDDIFAQPKVDGGLWCGDGLQFLVDPCRSSAEKPGKYDYGVSLTKKGAQAWSFFTADGTKAPAGEVKDFLLKITPTGERGNMIYELAIPWNRVSPFVPAPGADLGLAMIINEDDGQIRDSFIAWFGCAHSKQMSMNGDVILVDEKP